MSGKSLPGAIARRKLDHLNICLKDKVEPRDVSPFQKWKLPYKALPEIDLAKVDLSTKFCGWDVSCPLYVASMTGGEEHGRKINENLAIACNAEKIAFGLGSMRIIKRYPSSTYTFDVKSSCPDVPMFANVGLVQLNYGFTLEDINNLVDSVKADGIFIHINHLQEAVQPEGDTNFEGLIDKLAAILPGIKVPVYVKEVGHGFDEESARRLWDLGVKNIDVAGVGGTSWAWIEGRRIGTYNEEDNLGYLMREIGIDTDDSLLNCRGISPDLTLCASGGLRNGVDMVKALALGANHVSCAMPFLQAAMDSSDAVRAVIQRFKREMRVAMFACGASNIAELRKLRLQKNSCL